jgi:hypothetical protein
VNVPALGPLADVQFVDGSRPGEARFDVVITGILIWLMREYVGGLGAVEGPEGWWQGDGWRARVTEAEDFTLGSLRVGQVRLEAEGAPDSLAGLQRALAPKLVRGGG